MLFTTTKVVILLSIIYQSWGADNLALNKPARQISNYSVAGYHAGKAVNGNINDLSNTAEGQGNKWWTVDLQARYGIESIILYNRRDEVHLQSRLTKITILTSTVTSPADPSLSPGDWTSRNYRAEAYGSSGGVTFVPPIEARHVAVYSENTAVPLALAEVQVFVSGANHAHGKTAEQSSTHPNNNPSPDRAVDGDFSTTSITNFRDRPNNAWWKVNLGSRIFLREVTVYVRDGLCGPSNPKVDCSSRLSDVYLLTNPSDDSTDPNTGGNGGWRRCYHSVTALGNEFTKQCTEGTYMNPLTRLFSIRTNNGKSVELREVYVFGDDTELPELSGDIAITAEGVTASSITITFSQWTQQMTGGEPPTQYTVQLSGGVSKTVMHGSNSGRLSVTFDGLDARHTYTFIVSCTTIQDAACTGPTYSVTGTTICTDPDAPGTITLTNSIERHNNRQMWKYLAIWVVPSKANCPDALEYQYNVTGQSPSTLQTDVTAIFYLDGDQPFEFVVRAKNSVGYSTTRSKDGRSGVLKPQFTDGQVTVTTKSSTCVTFTWESPRYPGGTITEYKFNCTDGTISNSTNSSQLKAKLCEFPSATQVHCSVAAINSIGTGPPQDMSIYTQLRITNLDEAQLEDKISEDLIVPITINPIEVENVEVSTYIVMLSKVEARKKRSETNSCPNCYTAAEIPADKVVEGYVFNVGDDSTDNNGNVNKPLVEQSVYELYLGIQAIVPEMSEPLVKYLDPIRITVGKLEDSNWIVGVIAGIGVLILLAVGITLAVVIIKKRHRPPINTRNNPADSIDLSEYMHPPVPQPSHYTGLRFGEVRESDPCLDCEYETVAGDTRPDEQYETLAADPSLPDHVYATC